MAKSKRIPEAILRILMTGPRQNKLPKKKKNEILRYMQEGFRNDQLQIIFNLGDRALKGILNDDRNKRDRSGRAFRRTTKEV